jgi:hypothetical protein
MCLVLLIYVYFKFEDRYKKLQQPLAGILSTSISSSTVHQTTGLLRRNVMDSDSDSDSDDTNNSESWMVEFDRYIKTVEAVSKDADSDIVEWWGVS